MYNCALIELHMQYPATMEAFSVLDPKTWLAIVGEIPLYGYLMESDWWGKPKISLWRETNTIALAGIDMHGVLPGDRVSHVLT
jgi:hypothetical protein